MNRFSKFTNDELEVLEDALCQYGTKSDMIDEIRKQMKDRKPVSYEKNHCANCRNAENYGYDDGFYCRHYEAYRRAEKYKCIGFAERDIDE